MPKKNPRGTTFINVNKSWSARTQGKPKSTRHSKTMLSGNLLAQCRHACYVNEFECKYYMLHVPTTCEYSSISDLQ
jgi:hypothetical protein